MNKFKMKVKKHLTDELARIKSFSIDFYKGEQEGINFALYAIDSIDEPEKPVVPQFVADWYEEHKEDLEYNLYRLCINFHERKLYGDLYEWFRFDKNKPIEVLVLMNKYGYEIKKEKLYTVELPNPNRTDVSLVLGLYNDGKVAIFAVCTDSWKYEKRYKLTEAEIKKDFDWAWQFAKEVEEND
ncbi:DUF1642 domain-containing protein [Streptococcus gallolyticus]|uniref:DUF1642 domain-containing protein n=1 Tax=Streptococcus gallolyticus TaxID=315405 RepID=UPI003D6DBB07